MLIKNVQFTRLLKAKNGLREFNFTKTMADGKVIFRIDVTDDRNNRITFHMEKHNDVWMIQSPLLPEWITMNESLLHEFITEEMQS